MTLLPPDLVESCQIMLWVACVWLITHLSHMTEEVLGKWTKPACLAVVLPVPGWRTDSGRGWQSSWLSIAGPALPSVHKQGVVIKRQTQVPVHTAAYRSVAPAGYLSPVDLTGSSVKWDNIALSSQSCCEDPYEQWHKSSPSASLTLSGDTSGRSRRLPAQKLIMHLECV